MKLRAGLIIGLVVLALPFAAIGDEEPVPCGGDLPPCPPPPGITVTAEHIATSTVENAALTIFLIATTSDGTPVTFAIINTDNASGTVGSISGDQVLYTPDTDFVGEASFTYRASSGESDSEDATVTITVEAAPDTTPPELTASTHVIIATSSFSFMPASVYPTAEDDEDADVEITYEPSSIPTGTTEITWTGTDDAENEGTLVTELTIIEPIDIDLPDGCTVEDSAEVEHTFDGYLGICALQATLDAGDISAFEVSDSDFGLSLDSLNGTGAGATEFWAQWLNDGFASCGIECQTLAEGDVYLLVLTDWMANEESRTEVVAFRINSLVSDEPVPEPAPSGGGGGGGGGISHLSFNVPLAISYIASKQNANGSFENDLLSDWVALAFSAYDAGAAKTSLKNYMLTWSPALSNATDYERHAMALMALGINPYTGTSRDYISPIVAYFDGTQVGDATLATDDIFALFPLTKAGYSASDSMIQKIVAFIVAAQQSNGSWTGGVDVTAAAVQALSSYTSQPGVSDALTKAQSYLRGQQQTNGGFSNSFATSWTMQAIASLGQSESQWSSSSGYYPTDYLAGLQQTDGGVELASASASNRVWATSYAVPGALAKSWYALLSSFSRPTTVTTGGIPSTPATSTATTTPGVATSTPVAATSTAPVAPLATSTGQVLGLAVDNTVPDEIVAPLREALDEATPEQKEDIAELAAEIPESVQVAAAAAGVPQKYYFLFALIVLLLYGFMWYMVSWKKFWN